MTSRLVVSAEDELLLGLAATAARRRVAAGSLRELVRKANATRLLAVLARQRLTHLGIARLEEIGAGDLVAQVGDRLGSRLRAKRWSGIEQELLTHSLVGTLEEHQIDAVPLKGAVLARRIFNDPGLRESEDIDLLVCASELDRAVAIVRERFGYDAPCDARTTDRRPLLHYRMRHPDDLPTVELHWRLHWYETRSGPAMVSRSVPDQGSPRLAPPDELAGLLLVYARDGFAGIRPLADLAAWWDRHSAELPSTGLAEFVSDFPELGPALSVGSALADQLVGVPSARLGLSDPGRASPRERRAMRLANWRLEGKDEQIFADIALVDMLLTPPVGAWAFVRRQVLLPLDVAEGRLLASSPTRARSVLAATLHVPRVLARFVLALLATAGDRWRNVPMPSVASVRSARDATWTPDRRDATRGP